MPVIKIDLRDLRDLLGDVPEEETAPEKLAETISSMGASIEKMGGDEMEVEFFPNRPDLYSVEGVARALRFYLGAEKPGEYSVTPSGYTLTVEESVKQVRPYMVMAVVRNVVFDDPLIQSVMQVQEKLHATIGRNRKKVAIGIHDASKVKPPFFYRGVDPDSVSFVPLGHAEEMTMREILEKHEKGREYRHLVEDKPLFPLFVDSENNVLSFPPIINGALTTVTEDTTDLVLDVTGEDLRAMKTVLNILSTLFMERGARVETVEIHDPVEGVFVAPDLSYEPMDVGVDYVNRLLGTDASAGEIISHLTRMGYMALENTTPRKDAVLRVGIPPYRADILHPVDLVEDVAIAMGYQKLQPTLPRVPTIGKDLPWKKDEHRVREILVGLGFLEVATFTLIGKEDQFTKMRLPIGEDVPIKNPLTREHNSLRKWLIPSLLQILQANRHRDLPQKIFEIGDVVIKGENKTRVAAVIISSKTGFTEIKSHAEALLRSTVKEWEVVPKDHPSFIPGRCAAVVVGGEEIGFMGEIHPEVITNYKLTNPITAMEFDFHSLTPREK